MAKQKTVSTPLLGQTKAWRAPVLRNSALFNIYQHVNIWKSTVSEMTDKAFASHLPECICKDVIDKV